MRIANSWVVAGLIIGGWLQSHALAESTLPSPAALPAEIQLVAGELRSVTVDQPTRVAIGDPKIADVSIISDTELLLQAKATGKTTLVVWDRQGQHTAALTIVAESPEQVADQLRRLLEEVRLTSVRVDEEGRKVFVTGEVATEGELEQLQQLLRPYPGVTNVVSVALAPPPPLTPPPSLVRLSVQVVEMDRNYTEQLGVKWSESITFTEQPFALLPGAGSTTDSLVNTGASFADRFGEPFKFGTLFRTGFTQAVNFLVEKGKARILAEPTLVTASGKEATSFMGQEVPVITSTTVGVTTGGVTATIEFKEVGVKLTMTPTVLEAHEKINTVLLAEVSTVDTTNAIQVATGSRTVTVPSFKTRKTQTEVVTASGETIVIAGLLQSEDSHSVSQVPGLGSMPVVGRLFRSPSVKTKNTELVISVTPEMVVDASATEERSIALERALSTAEVTSAVDDPRLRYALQVQERISKSLRYPQRERELGIEGRVKLKLHLFADGTLGRVMVLESSGTEALDLEALKAAESQTPYPAFPSQLAERELWIEVPVIFRP